MEEQKEKLAQYYITIKQVQNHFNHYSYNDPKRQQAQEAAQNKLHETFIKVVNEVVALGGVICMDKQQLDSEWRIFATAFTVKMLPSVVSKVEKMPDVHSCVLQNQS